MLRCALQYIDVIAPVFFPSFSSFFGRKSTAKPRGSNGVARDAGCESSVWKRKPFCDGEEVEASCLSKKREMEVFIEQLAAKPRL